jgi:PAS domain S-box-containing protein
MRKTDKAQPGQSGGQKKPHARPVTTKPAGEKHNEAEEALRESEARFRLLFEHAPLGYQSLDADGNFLDVNPAWLELFGRERDEVIGHWFGEFIVPEQHELLRKIFQHFKEVGEVHGIEYEMVRKDGTHLIISFDAKVGYDEKGNFKQTHCLLSNVTERKRVEEALRESEEKYRSLVERANDGITIIQDGVVKFANTRLIEMWGGAVEKVLETPFANHIHPDQLPAMVERYQQRMAGEDTPTMYETVLLRSDGSKVYVEINAGVIAYLGKPADLVVVRDITERKRAEEALRESERELREAQSLGRVGSWGFDLESQKITWSDQAYRLYERDPVLGPPTVEEEAAYYSPEQAQVLHEYARRAIEEGQDFEYDLEATLPSGKRASFSAKMRPVKDARGRIVKLFGTAQDITERKRAEQALAESEIKFRWLYEYAPSAYHLLTPDGTITDVNRRWCELLGYRREEVLGKAIFDFVVEEEREAAKASFEKKKQSRQPYVEGSERNFKTKDGAVRTFKTYDFFVLDQRQNITSVQTTIEDITERKRAEEALRLRVEQLSALSQASQAVTMSLDLDQVLTEVMSLAGKVVGSEYTSIVLVDEVGHISRGVENMPGVLSIERRARKRGFTSWVLRARRSAVVDEIGEAGVVRPRVGGGAPRTANPNLVAKGIKSFVGLPLIVEDHVLGMLYLHSLRPGTFHDQLTLLTTFASQAAIAIEKARLYDAVQKELAERKQAEEALQRERDTAQQYLDITGVLMAALDTDGQITLINQKGCEILGYKERELIGRNWFDTCLSEDAREEVKGVFERLMAGDVEPVEYYENAVLTKSGEQRILAFHNSVIQDQNSQTAGILFSGEDITERKRAEAELQASREAERIFSERLTILSETTTELSKAESLDGLCRRTIELGRERLDFDRLSIWFYSEDTAAILGTYGIDTEGRITDERGDRYPVSALSYIWPILQSQTPLIRLEDAPLALKGKDVGQGTHVIAGLWDGNRAIGFISVDNLLRQRPFSDRDCEIIRLYASAVGHLVSLKRAQEEIRASEERFAKSFQSNPIAAIIDILPDGRLLDVNEAFLRLTGYNREEVIGKTGLELNLWADPEARSRLRQGLFEQRLLRDVESQLLTKSGEIRHILASAEIIEIAGQPHALIMLSDITERKRAEETLRQSEAKYRSIFDNAAEGIFQSTPEGKFLTANPAMARILGFSSPEELIRERTDIARQSYVHPEQREEFKRLMEQQNKVSGFEYEVPRKDGSVAWVSETAQAVWDATGRIVRYEGIFIDITERKQAVEALAQERNLLRSLIDNVPDYIYVKDTQSRFMIVNTALAHLVGSSTPDDLLGKTDFDFFPQELAAKYFAGEQALFQSGQALLGCEEPTLDDAGNPRWASTTKVPLRDAQGNIFGLVGMGREITERKQAEEALARQAEELRQRNEELARLYRASGSLISGTLLRYQDLAQTIVEIVQQEFGQSNCSLLVVQKDSNELVRLVASGPYAERVKYQNLALDGPGLIPLAIRTNKVVNVGDVHSAPDYVQGWEAAQSELAIPLKVGSDVIGAIDVQSSEPNAFSPDDERLMTVFAERAALALEHSRLNAQTEARLQQLTALRTVDMAISGSFDINLTLGVLLDQVTGQLGVHAADILAFNATTQMFKFACERGFRTQMLQRTQLKFGAGYAWRAIRERRAVVVPDIQVEPDGLQRFPDLSGEQFVAYLGMPLIAKGQIKGVLEVFHREPLDLEKERYGFLEMLAGQAAIAIDNAELFDRLQSSNADLTMAYNSTLEGWASALEMRDKETEGHTRRVTELTIQLARALGVKENDMVHIYRGALLHDIGKVGVPDSIVLKPGPLTEDEWVIMRKHPQYAYNMLSPIAYLRLALDIPYFHHEKWDGTGYPRGLKGEQIPLAARIFAVVDVWDALISDRPYRKAWQKAKARQYIQEQAGLYFDPRVVRAFLNESFKKG